MRAYVEEVCACAWGGRIGWLLLAIRHKNRTCASYSAYGSSDKDPFGWLLLALPRENRTCASYSPYDSSGKDPFGWLLLALPCKNRMCASYSAYDSSGKDPFFALAKLTGSLSKARL